LKFFLREAPEDPFANDFLGTTYLLAGNLDAALKYWNRAGKPRLREIHTDPPLQIDPVLLDHTFAFSRAGELQAGDYYKTRAQLDSLGVFTRYRFDLTPTDSDSFDMTLRATERTGPDWLSWLGGLPYQTVYPGWWNLRHRAVNIESLVRWDPEKRRASLSVAWPGGMGSSLRYRIHSDARDENWQLPTTSFKLRRTEFGGSADAILSDTWTWQNSVALTRRSFTTTFTSAFERGTALNYSTTLRHVLLRIPERQLTIDSALSAQAGKLFTQPSARFLKTEGYVGLQWQDFRTRLRSGKTFGGTPFDELFVLGVDRDSDLRLRGHPATISGRKGAAPVVPGYVLLNNDFEKTVVDKSVVKLRVGPFVDTARVSFQSAWLIDSGIQLKLSILSAFTFTASAGWNVHGGSHAVFIENAR
jgi:hypothetical protein